MTTEERRQIVAEGQALARRIKGLETQLAASQERIADLEARINTTYCAFCGATYALDDGTGLIEHIMSCPQHPMRELEHRNRQLQATLDAGAEEDT